MNVSSLARLFEGIPVAERRLDLAGASTSLFQGGDGVPIVLLHALRLGAEREHVCVDRRIVLVASTIGAQSSSGIASCSAAALVTRAKPLRPASCGALD